MTMPTLPSMWTDILSAFNLFLAWDPVKGYVVLMLGLALGSAAIRQLTKVGH